MTGARLTGPATRPLRRAALVVALTMVSGCSSDDDGGAAVAPTSSSTGAAPTTAAVPTTEAEPTTTSSTTTTTTTVGDPASEEAVVAGYRAAWATYLGVAESPDPDAPGLSEHYADVELERMERIMGSGREAGTAGRGSVELSPQVIARDDDRAVVWDCIADSTEEYRIDTGEVIDEPGIQQLAYETHLIRVADTWKIGAVYTEERACQGT